MKHLSQVPEPPSAKRHDLPHDVDLLVMRALAKDPDDRYQSAEEMDGDLDRVARGLAVSRETEESATHLLRADTGAMAIAATMIAPPSRRAVAAPPRVHRRPSTRPRRAPHKRPLGRRSPRSCSSSARVSAVVPVRPDLEQDLRRTRPSPSSTTSTCTQSAAEDKIRAIGLTPVVKTGPSPTTAPGWCPAGPDRGREDPEGQPGHDPDLDRQAEGRGADARRAAGGRRGRGVEDAAPEARRARGQLGRAAGQVTAQDPKAGTQVVIDTSVRINVSKGPQPITIPDVTGQTIDAATVDAAGRGLPGQHDLRRLAPAANTRDQPEPGRRARPRRRARRSASRSRRGRRRRRFPT